MLVTASSRVLQATDVTPWCLQRDSPVSEGTLIREVSGRLPLIRARGHAVARIDPTVVRFRPQDGGPPSDPPENVVASDSQKKDYVKSMCD
jgi:hypothetical protein